MLGYQVLEDVRLICEYRDSRWKEKEERYTEDDLGDLV
jgi:hypothetical protein